jgi:hypothetical protein
MSLQPRHFYGEPIEPIYQEPPTYEKKPDCPDGFSWRGTDYRVSDLLNEWADFERRGRMARNMQPQHARVAANRGSLGVGRFYFRVRTDTGQVFEIYYDRAIKDSDHRKGSWVLVGEYEEKDEG